MFYRTLEIIYIIHTFEKLIEKEDKHMVGQVLKIISELIVDLFYTIIS